MKPLISATTEGVTAWKVLKEHFEPVTHARVIHLLDEFFGLKFKSEDDVGLFLCKVKAAASRLRDAGHELDNLYVGVQMIR